MNTHIYACTQFTRHHTIVYHITNTHRPPEAHSYTLLDSPTDPPTLMRLAGPQIPRDFKSVLGLIFSTMETWAGQDVGWLNLRNSGAPSSSSCPIHHPTLLARWGWLF